MATKLEQRLAAGTVICGEGYLFELERRGYVQIGPFVPEVVVDHPEVVKGLHREFLRAGSDVIEAFTYYANRQKLRLIGREAELENLNKKALQLAKEVAAEGDALVAGNLSNTTVFDKNSPEAINQVKLMFDETTRLAAEAKVDFIIAETFDEYEEAELALEAIKKVGLPSVITFSVHQDGKLRDGMSLVDACLKLQAAGATVVGTNCARGPATMIPLLEELRKAVKGPIAALPVPFRTTEKQPTMQSLCSHDKMYMELEPHLCTRFEMAEFAKKAVEIGVNYIGVCCGGAPYHVRAMAEAIGRHPPASKYSADLSKHFSFGNHELLAKVYTDQQYRDTL